MFLRCGNHNDLGDQEQVVSQMHWSAVDQYITDLVVMPDAALSHALQTSHDARLPAIAVAPNQGKLLQLLARMTGARRILEIGTLGGYSTIWLARALATDGTLITLESSAHHAAVARDNIASAGLSHCVEVRVGAALDTLPQLAGKGLGPFDFIFIDADKPNIPEYFDWSVRLAHRGSVIVVDNVIRDGRIVDANSTDPSVLGVRRFNAALSVDARVDATTLQTVGSKGYDGFTLAVVVTDT